jgi:NADH:ubiquinone oxidoreductase subunit 6 (subunit J)
MLLQTLLQMLLGRVLLLLLLLLLLFLPSAVKPKKSTKIFKLLFSSFLFIVNFASTKLRVVTECGIHKVHRGSLK